MTNETRGAAMKTETDDTTFEMGFQGAAKKFAWGLTVEDMLTECRHLHTEEYQNGAQAWADLYLGWTSTPFARRAEKMGLRT